MLSEFDKKKKMFPGLLTFFFLHPKMAANVILDPLSG